MRWVRLVEGHIDSGDLMEMISGYLLAELGEVLVSIIHEICC